MKEILRLILCSNRTNFSKEELKTTIGHLQQDLDELNPQEPTETKLDNQISTSHTSTSHTNHISGMGWVVKEEDIEELQDLCDKLNVWSTEIRN